MSLTKTTYSMIDGAAVNVFDYGAVGDGVADDTAAINAAITYALTFMLLCKLFLNRTGPLTGFLILIGD